MARIESGTGPLVICAEVDAYRPGSGIFVEDLGWGAAPVLCLSRFATPAESFDVIRASDLGYRSRETDANGLLVYPPLLETSYDVDRRLALSPQQAAVGAGWGSLKLRSLDGALAPLAAASSCDGRGVRITAARRDWDATRKLWLDPPQGDFAPLLLGLAGGTWSLADTTLDIPLRDASYWLETNLQAATFAGTGGIEGAAELTGKPKPRLRGGTLLNPVRNIPPVLVDPVSLIYAVSDADFSIAALYEGGDTGIGKSPSTADLYGSVCPPGTYRLGTGDHLGFFQLGSKPSRQIAVDAYGGAFPGVGGTPTSVALITYYMLKIDMSLPAECLNQADWIALDAACNWQGGTWTGTDFVTGDAAIGALLQSIGAKLVPMRNGTLKPLLLRALARQTPAASYTEAEIVSLQPVPLDAPISPPPRQWTVGYQRNYLTQTSDLDPDVTADRQAVLKETWRTATSAVNATVAAQIRRPSDPGIIETALTSATDAAAFAAVLDAVWSTQRRSLYSVELPTHLALSREIGDVVQVTWPGGLLSGGLLGQVVGESYRGGGDTATLLVLTATNETLLSTTATPAQTLTPVPRAATRQIGTPTASLGALTVRIVAPNGRAANRSFGTITATTGTAAWAPSALPNLVLALDSNNTASAIDDGSGKASEWRHLYDSTRAMAQSSTTNRMLITTTGGASGTKRALTAGVGRYWRSGSNAAIKAALDGTTTGSTWTVAFAVQFSSDTVRNEVFVMLADSTPNSWVNLMARRDSGTNDTQFRVRDNVPTNFSATKSAPALSGWHQVTVIKDGTAMRFRVDGTQVASATTSGSGSFAGMELLMNATLSAGSPVTTDGGTLAYSGFLLCSAALSGTDLTNAEAWLNTTAGIGGGVAPGQVTGLTAGTATASSVPLSWTAPATGTTPFTYNVDYSATASTGPWTSFATAISGTSTTVTGLAASTQYWFRVSAVNTAGTGTPSSSATATTTAFSWAPSSLGSALVFAADTNDTTNTPSDGSMLQDIYTSGTKLVQPTVGNRPSVVTASGASGTKRVLSYGSTGYLYANGNHPALVNLLDGPESSTTAQMTYCIAVQPATGASRYSFMGNWDHSGAYYAQLRQSGSNLAFQVNDGSVQASAQNSSQVSGWHVITAIRTGKSLVVRLDGTQIASATITGTATLDYTEYSLGGYDDGSGSLFAGSAPVASAGMIVTNTALSGTDLSNVEAWVANTCGL